MVWLRIKWLSPVLGTGTINSVGNDSGEPLEHNRIVGAEGVRFGREHFQKADDGIAPQNRHRNHGTNAKRAAALAIYQGIGFRVFTSQQLPSSHALPGKT